VQRQTLQTYRAADSEELWQYFRTFLRTFPVQYAMCTVYNRAPVSGANWKLMFPYRPNR